MLFLYFGHRGSIKNYKVDVAKWGALKWRLFLHRIDNELECCARELIAYLDSVAGVEQALPSPVGFMVKQMRAAIFAKALRTLAPAQRCRIYRHCRALSSNGPQD